jgi:CheY-like chemotaxis protein
MPAPTLLIVDDDPDLRASLAAVLRDAGYTVAEAENGHEAHQYLKTTPTQPGLILLDLVMPVMSGQQFLDVIAADPKLSSLHVIVLSAAADERPLNGVIQVLRKPVMFRSLLRVVEAHCGKAEPQPVTN